MPLFLYINTTEREDFEIALLSDQKAIKRKTVKSVRRHSEKLLLSVNNLLIAGGHELKDINGIVVAKGQGSFTSLRIGIAMANALSYALGAPVVGIEAGELDLSGSRGKIDKTVLFAENGHSRSLRINSLFKQTKSPKIITPRYGQDFNAN